MSRTDSPNPSCTSTLILVASVQPTRASEPSGENFERHESFRVLRMPLWHHPRMFCVITLQKWNGCKLPQTMIRNHWKNTLQSLHHPQKHLIQHCIAVYLTIITLSHMSYRVPSFVDWSNQVFFKFVNSYFGQNYSCSTLNGHGWPNHLRS